MNTNDIVVNKIIRKTDINATSKFDLKKITYVRNEFINCSIKENIEDLEIAYNIDEKREFTGIRDENILDILKSLMYISTFANVYNEYKFSLSPDNIYYDIYNKVYILERDTHNDEDAYNEEIFLNQYKSLIGFSLQKKFTYDDYLKGGIDLLKKNTLLKKIFEADDLYKIKELLYDEYIRLKEEISNNKILVSKRKNKNTKSLLRVLYLCIAVMAISLSYLLIWVKPYDDAVILANNAYLKNDYITVIDSLDKINISRLDNYQKYMLATSYVKGEDLSNEQKEIILSTLSITGNEKILDYWIYIGRLNASEAENIAMQISNDQLLLYAYLKERYLIELDTQISGEEKANRLTNIQSKIDPLAQKYGTEE